MDYAAINNSTNAWEFQSTDLESVQNMRRELEKAGIHTSLVALLEGEYDAIGTYPKPTKEARQALIEIVGAANANPHPIHYNVKAAIDRARDILRS